MDQFVVFHFSMKKNDRVYQLMIQPGCPYEDVQEVLAQFQADFVELKKNADEKERQAKEEAPIEPEIVNADA